MKEETELVCIFPWMSYRILTEPLGTIGAKFSGLICSTLLKIRSGDISPVFLSSLPVCLSVLIYVTADILWQNVTLTYCPTSDRISVSWPIWMMLFCSQPEPWQNIRGPDPMSRCSDHTSAAPFPYTGVLSSSAPVFFCCLERCPRSWERQDQRKIALKAGKSLDN